MKYINQIAIIAAVAFAGELLAHLLPLPIPGSIYGLILLFTLFLTKIVKLSQVKEIGDFLLSLMPIMFVSPLVALIENIDACREFIVPILLTATVSTAAVMAVTGLVSQMMIQKQEKKEGEKKDD